MRRTLCSVLFAVLLPPATVAANADVRADANAVAAASAPVRPRIGLVLSGGGARGFAHIGVLQVLEELRVPVDVIAATSMGSIIGGAYAAGYSPEQLQRLARTNDWDAIFSVRAPRADLPFRRKEDDEKNLSSIEFGIKSTGLTLPRGAFGAQNLGLFLRALGGPVQEINDLATLPIPFAAVATDLGSGKMVVLQADLPLATAMRASMSVPGAIAPVEWQGRALVDGGLVRNLPVDVARRMGADVIIAVNVGRPLAPTNSLSNLLAVTDQMVSLLIEQNVDKSLAELRADDVLITPTLEGVGSSDFLQGEAMIAAGAAAARALAPRLGALALDPQDYERYEQRRRARMLDEHTVRLAAIRVEGLKTVNAEAVTRTLDLPLQQALRPAEITAAVQRAYATGDFEAVNYRLLPVREETSQPAAATPAPELAPASADGVALKESTARDAPQTLIVTPYEKPWGYNTLRFGGNVATDFKGSNVFNILFAHTWGWRNSYGAEWRNEVQFGDTQRLFSEWYQPLAPASRWFVSPQVQAKRETFDLYLGRQPVARFQNTSTEANLQLGYAVGQLGSVRAGVGHSVIETATLIGPPLLPVTRVDTTGFSFNARLDTLDSLSFPRHGFLFNGSYTRYSSLTGSAEAKDAWTVEATRAVSLARYVLALSGRAGMAAQEGTFRLGGFLNLSGTPVGEVSGARVAFARALLTRNVSDALGDLAMPVYAGVSLEAGTAGPRRDPFHGFEHAATFLLGADSPIGPVYLGLGHTFGRTSALYLYWGRPL